MSRDERRQMEAFGARLETASAALARGLSAEWSWSQIEAQARKLALQIAAWPVEERASSVASPCVQNVARALEALAQHAPSAGGARARETGFWAAATFAMGANFPSALVAVRRTAPRLASSKQGDDPLRATLLLALAPSLQRELSFSPLAAPLWAALNGERNDDEVLEAFERAAHDFGAPEVASAEVWRVARAGLEAVLWSATARRLSDFAWPDGFVPKLSARVPTLLPPQIAALGAGLLREDSSLVALPPGTGKTLLGELILASALADGRGLAVFLVPYIALARGVVSALRAHLPPSVEVVTAFAREGRSELQPSQCAQVLVATPESFDALVRADASLWSQVRALVVDEAHSIGEGARGLRLEGLIGRFKTQRQRFNVDSTSKLALLSAALDEAEPLRAWTGAPRVISSDWTPTARRSAFWRGDGQLEWRAEVAGAGSVALGATKLRPPCAPLRAGDAWMAMRRQEAAVWKSVAHLARSLHETRGGAVLCLCSTRAATRELARQMAATFPHSAAPSGARAKAVALIETSYPPLLPLARLLERGVAWHNSSLPGEVRALVEDAVREGQIAAVAATTTLAEGVDLPFAQTILAQWMRWEDGAQKPLPGGLFRNIAGRCGRAGAFTEGETFVYDNPLGPLEWTAPDVRAAHQERLYGRAKLSAPRSVLGAETRSEAVEAEWESQLLAALAEQERTELGSANEPLWRGLTAFPDEEAAMRERWRAGKLWDGATITPLGRAFARSGLSAATNRRLLDTLRFLPSRSFDDALSQARLLAFLWSALGAPPEAGGEVARLFRPRSRFAMKPTDLEAVALSWLRGESLERMFAGLPYAAPWPQIARWAEPDDFESGENELPVDVSAQNAESQNVEAWGADYDAFCDFVRAGFENWTPVLWRAANLLAPFAGERARAVSWNSWASCWRVGADSPIAVLLHEWRAPGGREALAALGRELPTSGDILLQPACDAVGERASEFKSDLFGRDSSWRDTVWGERETIEAAVARALEQVGGPFCRRGRQVVALADWLRGRAGWTK